MTSLALSFSNEACVYPLTNLASTEVLARFVSAGLWWGVQRVPLPLRYGIQGFGMPLYMYASIIADVSSICNMFSYIY